MNTPQNSSESFEDRVSLLEQKTNQLFNTTEPFIYRDRFLKGLTALCQCMYSPLNTAQTSYTELQSLRLYVPKGIKYLRYSANLRNSAANETRLRISASLIYGNVLVLDGSTWGWVDSVTSMDISDLAKQEGYYTFTIEMKVSAGTGYLNGLSIYYWDE